MSLREAADRCGISTSRLRRLASRGVLSAQKIGSYWAVSERAMADFEALERPHGVRASARHSGGEHRAR
jgi:hypothetical protein